MPPKGPILIKSEKMFLGKDQLLEVTDRLSPKMTYPIAERGGDVAAPGSASYTRAWEDNGSLVITEGGRTRG